jgi:uncharacterized protein (DUF3084 family)
MIGRYPDTNISQEELSSELNSKRYGFAKANLIAKPALLDTLMKFNTELAANVLKLSLSRQNLINIKEQLAGTNEEINKHIAEREVALSSVKTAQLNGNQNRAQIESLDQVFKWTQSELERLTKEQRDLQTLFRTKWLELVKQSREATNSLNTLLPPLVSAARLELEIPIDETSYAKSINSALAEQEKNFEAFLTQISPGKNVEPAQNG